MEGKVRFAIKFIIRLIVKFKNKLCFQAVHKALLSLEYLPGKVYYFIGYLITIYEVR